MTFMKCIGMAALLAAMWVASSNGGAAQNIADTELEVAQIAATEAPSDVGDGAPLSASIETSVLPGPDSRIRNLVPQLTARLLVPGQGNAALVDQAGIGNTTMLHVMGQSNSTLQLQRGLLNTSDLALRGAGNRVVVDQRGSRLNSDITLGDRTTGPALGETLIHIQRGRGNFETSQPIPTGALDGSPLIVVDTSRGRRMFSLPGGLGASPVPVGIGDNSSR
jgi:hypothetical protein